MPKKAGWLAAAIVLLVANIALARLGGVIKTRLATMVAVLALVLALPAVAETQTECKQCEMDWCEVQGQQMLCHRFAGEGGVKYECGGISEDHDGETAPSGPVARRTEGSCEDCHEDFFAWLCNWNHDQCFTMPLPHLLAEVDQMVSALDPISTAPTKDPTSKLAVWIAETETLTVDPTLGMLRLSDCSGNLIEAWKVPRAFLERLGGGSG